jgi:hypothetical protein
VRQGEGPGACSCGSAFFSQVERGDKTVITKRKIARLSLATLVAGAGAVAMVGAICLKGMHDELMDAVDSL